MEDPPYPYAPQFFATIGSGLMLTSLSYMLFTEDFGTGNTLFLFSTLTIFTSLAFQVANLSSRAEGSVA
jgi:hypothetical protein